MQLNWTYEGATPLPPGAPRFAHAGSNICLDFHGDPRTSGLVVFSDGNHHMALADALATFRSRYAEVNDIFYVTTPPRVVADAMMAGVLAVGHLRLSIRPNVFIGPATLLERLSSEGHIVGPKPFAASRGNVMLVRKGNPRRIAGVADLARDDVRLFLSNPVTEAASHRIYTTTLRQVAARQGVDTSFLDTPPGAASHVVYGECIHHREAPQYLVDDRADVAIVFHHLALRYTRIFPGTFDFIPLTREDDPDQVIGRIWIALVGNGGEWGARLVEFMLGEEVACIYREHGLAPYR